MDDNVVDFPLKPPESIRIGLQCPVCDGGSWIVIVHGSFWPVAYTCVGCGHEIDLEERA